jgi:hypothetical protein
MFAVVTRWKFKDSQDELLLVHTEPEFLNSTVIDLQEKEPRNRVSIAGAPERL